MIELKYNGPDEEVAPNADVPFNTAIKGGCAERYEAGTNTLTLLKPGRYLVSASANIALPGSGTASTQMRIAIATNGTPVLGAVMESTPASVSTFNNIATQTYVDVYPCCCKTVSLRNIGVPTVINNQNLTAVRVSG